MILLAKTNGNLFIPYSEISASLQQASPPKNEIFAQYPASSIKHPVSRSVTGFRVLFQKMVDHA